MATATKIMGMDPADYAALWGSTTGDGPLFYNVSSESNGWGRNAWARFVDAVDRLMGEVESSPENYGPDDGAELSALRDWAMAHYVAA